VQFQLDAARLVSNAGEPDRIEIDFDDGNGFREVTVGGKQAVHYDEPGEHRVVLRARYGAELRIAAFLFRVEPVNAPNPDGRFSALANIRHRGDNFRCHIYYWYGQGNTRITRPFVLAEGFPGGTNPEDLYDRINGKVGARSTRKPSSPTSCDNRAMTSRPHSRDAIPCRGRRFFRGQPCCGGTYSAPVGTNALV
jgi:hypothetical protein